MATLRSALRHLALDTTRFLSKAGGSGPSFTPVRRKHSTGGGVSYYMILGDDPIDLRNPVTWFAIIGYTIGVTYKITMREIRHEKRMDGEAILKVLDVIDDLRIILHKI